MILSMKSPSLKPVTAGFTLVEIVIVLTIIAILAGGSIYMLKGLVGEAQDSRVVEDIRAVEIALGAFERNNYFKPPTPEQGLQALVTEPTSDPKPQKWRQYLEDVPKDPWGNPYQYKVPGTRSGKAYDLFSLGKDGVESDDDIGNWKK